MPVEGFKGDEATDGSLLGKTGKWEACGWAVVQLDYVEEIGAFARNVWFSGGRTRSPVHHQEGGVDGLLMPFEKSDWASQGPC